MLVVLIHCIPAQQLETALIIRPILNPAVAVFLFLSGYLTRNKNDVGASLIVGRLKKVLIPYVVWSVIYSLAKGSNTSETVFALITGSASAQLYYLLVYAQLTVITPLLIRHRSSITLYLITPVFLLVKMATNLFDITWDYWSVLFPSWIIFYQLGLDWNNVAKRFDDIPFAAIAAVFLSTVFIQIMCGEAWANLDSSMAVTQLKLSSMFTSLMAILFIMKLPQKQIRQLSSSKLLTKIGDCSFGIYLCHTGVLVIVNTLFASMSIDMGFLPPS